LNFWIFLELGGCLRRTLKERMAYCLHITLKQYTKALAPGLTPRAVIEKMASIQMIDVHLPTTDGRQVILSRYTEYTEPEKDHQLLLQRLNFQI